MYRRLLGYLQPHTPRMVGTILCNIVAAALDVFSFTLLVPFLSALFGTQEFATKSLTGTNWISRLQDQLIGAFLNPADRLGSVEAMMVAIMAIVLVKNV